MVTGTPNELLEQRNPDIAAFVRYWEGKYNRTIDLNNSAEQANFYEALVELARHVAVASDSVTLDLHTSVDGVSGLRVASTPKPGTSSSL